jgi:hypothetical protein
MRHILKNIAARFYSPEKYWWLSEEPPRQSAEQRSLEKVIKAVFETMMPNPPCPDAEKLAAYAFDELPRQDSRSVESHIISCRNCFEEVISLRHIHATIPLPSAEDAEAIPGTLAVVERILERTRPKILRLSKWITEKRDQMAASLGQAMLRLFPQPVALSYAPALRGTALEIKLPKSVWHVQRVQTDPFVLVDRDDKELQELSGALHEIWFYYTLFGLNRRNEVIAISDGPTAVPMNSMPLTLNQR